MHGKGEGWLSNFPLDLLSRKCSCPDALGTTEHYHVHARGEYTDGSDGRRKKLSKYTAQYTAAEAASYATSLHLRVASRYTRVDVAEMEKDPTELVVLAQRSGWYAKYRGGPPREIGAPSESDTSTQATKGSATPDGGRRRPRRRKRRSAGQQGTEPAYSAIAYPTKEGTISYASLGLCSDRRAEQGSYSALVPVQEDPEPEEEWDIQLDGVGATHSGTGEFREAPKPMVGDPDVVPPQRTMAEEQEDRRRHRVEQDRWNQIWMKRAKDRDWDQVRAPLEAYRYSGFRGEITSDPRRTPEYVESVVQGLGVAEGSPPLEGLTEEDMKAVREVVRRKAAALWIEGTPRTTLLHLMHDTRPTGPPVRTPPHNLKAEDSNCRRAVDEGSRNGTA